MIRSFASNIADSSLNQWISEIYWLWPVLEIFHFLGLSILFGALVTIDARLLGLVRNCDALDVKRFVPLAWVGFCINLATGTLFFIGDPMRYAINIGFQLKMLLILIAGLNVVAYQLQVRPLMAGWSAGAATTPAAKLIAITSLLAWTGVLLLGRLIPYVGTG